MCLFDDLNEFLEGALQPKTFEEVCQDGFGFETEGKIEMEFFPALYYCDMLTYGDETGVHEVEHIYPFHNEIIADLGLDGEDSSCDDGEVEDGQVYDLQSGVDWEVPPPANTLLFRPGWGGFGLSPIL